MLDQNSSNNTQDHFIMSTQKAQANSFEELDSHIMKKCDFQVINNYHHSNKNTSYLSDRIECIDENYVVFDKMEDIIDHIGFNRKTLKITIITSLYCFIEGFSITYFSNILTPFQTYYQISDNLLSIIASLNFIAMIFGGLFSGYFSQIFSRKIIIISINIFLIIFHLCLSLIKNLIVFSICRFVSSFFLGIYSPLIFNILTEYLPIKFRGFILNSIYLFWGLGSLFFLFCCKIFIPKLEYIPGKPDTGQDFYSAILQLIFILLLNLFLSIFYLEDSPRNMIINGEIEEAKKILKFYTDNKITSKDINEIKKNIFSKGENKYYEKENGFKEIFNKRILKMSILILFISFLISFPMHGLTVSLPLILKSIEIKSKDSLKVVQENNNLINSLIFNSILSSFSCIFGGFFSEIKSLGRKYSAIIFYLFSVIFSFLGVSFINNFNVFNTISLSLFYIGYNLFMTYSREIYPTKIRDYAMGINSGITSLGGFISQLVFILIAKSNPLFTIYLFIFIIIISSVLIFFLPRDNVMELDSYIAEFEDENLLKESN